MNLTPPGNIWRHLRNLTLIAGVLWIFALFYVSESAGSEPLRVVNPEPGIFLYAVPEMMDPNFLHTVVLLVTYSSEGATGVIINRRSDYLVEEAFPDVEEAKNVTDPLYFGGPVSRDRVFFLLRGQQYSKESAIRVFGDIYFSWNPETLTEYLRESVSDSSLRIFYGYAGWGPGQLDREIARKDWVLSRARPDAVFSNDPESVWLEIFDIQDRIEIKGEDFFKRGPEASTAHVRGRRIWKSPAQQKPGSGGPVMGATSFPAPQLVW